MSVLGGSDEQDAGDKGVFLAMELPEIKVNHIETKSVMTKSNGPLGGYAVNPYVGCPHACKYCYASFMKRFTGHTEEYCIVEVE